MRVRRTLRLVAGQPPVDISSRHGVAATTR
jgi:hypothetical protein